MIFDGKVRGPFGHARFRRLRLKSKKPKGDPLESLRCVYRVFVYFPLIEHTER